MGPSGIRFTLDSFETRRLVIRYTLRRIARGRPLLFCLDDLHNSGQTTFEGLLRVHEEEPDQRIVMVATVRSEDVQLGTPQAEQLRQLREAMNGIVIDVKPLEPETTVALLRASLPLDEPSVLEAARRSRGNPLFALQQLHAWALAGNMQLAQGMYHVPQDVLNLRPQTTAELWDSRVNAMPEEHRLAAYAVATLGSDIRRNVLHALLTRLGLPADECIVSLQKGEIILPRGAGRYSWPHALLQEHLLAELLKRPDAKAIFIAASDALAEHPLARQRRVVRQRAANMLYAGEPETAAQLIFDWLTTAWNRTREPASTLGDLELLKGHLTGQQLALKHRWQAEALRHLGQSRRSHDPRRDRARSLRRARRQGEPGQLPALARTPGQRTRVTASRASSSCDKAHAIFSELGNVLGMAQCEAVLGEIEYLLGNYDRARGVIEAGERHFAELGQPLGRGQCLLAHVVDRPLRGRDRARTASDPRGPRASSRRLAIASASPRPTPPSSHVEHRLMNFYSAELGALEALTSFEASANAARPRGVRAAAGDDRHRHRRSRHGGDTRGPLGQRVSANERPLGHRRVDAALVPDLARSP